MSTAYEQAKAKAKTERLAASRWSSGSLAAKPQRAGLSKPIRITLDIYPALYYRFEDWAIAASRQTGIKSIRRRYYGYYCSGSLTRRRLQMR